MSHKQAKRARKGIPHLNPNFIREKHRLQAEALLIAQHEAIQAARERREREAAAADAAQPKVHIPSSRVTGLALLAAMSLAGHR